MSQIKLKVPKGTDIPEHVSHGNFAVDLQPGKTIAVDDRGIADWLTRGYGLEEIGSPSTSAAEPAEPEPSAEPVPESDFPTDFPRREVFAGQGVTFEQLRGLNKKQLIDLTGVGAATADRIIAYFAGGNTDGGTN